MSTLRVSLVARIDVADTRPSKPVPPWKLMWSPVVTWSRLAPAMWSRIRRRAAGSGMSRASLTATPASESRTASPWPSQRCHLAHHRRGDDPLLDAGGPVGDQVARDVAIPLLEGHFGRVPEISERDDR